MKLLRRVTGAAMLVAAMTLTALAPQAMAQQAAQAGVEAAAPETLAQELWHVAKAGDVKRFEQTLASLAKLNADGDKSPLAVGATRLVANFEKREADRAAREKELRADLAKHLDEKAE
ncbi:MAG: hypothetical protein ACOYN0_17450, partial [Phycisphaerales bacterium]